MFISSFPLNSRRNGRLLFAIAFLGLISPAFLLAQTATNTLTPSPEVAPADATNSSLSTTVAPTNVVNPAPPEPAAPISPAPSPTYLPKPTIDQTGSDSDSLALAALLVLASIGGFLLYHCGLTRAKNCGHTSMVLLIGVVFGWLGYWAGGFAVQNGGVGDAHAAISGDIPASARDVLDHEFGFMAAGHYWGLMGNSGFFLTTSASSASGIASLFLIHASFLSLILGAALGAALERSRIIAMAIASLLISLVIYPLLANWVWGGGWLAELGSSYGFGHGSIDLAGAGVVHETAGTLALVIAVALGPRYGRFARDKISRIIPGHNLPFVVLGTVILLLALTAANVLVSGNLSTTATSLTSLAAVNTLLAAAGGLVISLLTGAWQNLRPEPTRLCRGLLGGAIASSAGAALIDPWAAFVIGGLAAIFVQGTFTFLEKLRIDDPVGAAATHGASGAWGVLATGLFANGLAGQGINGVESGVRGLFFGGNWHQLAAQGLECVTTFVVVYILGYASLILIHKIVGLRAELTDETGGLDWPQIGALGYQGDSDADDLAPRE